MTSLGEYVSELREAEGWTQRELAKKADCSHTTIHKIENNLFKQPSIDLILGLARAFKVSPLTLLRAYEGKRVTGKDGIDIDAMKRSLHQAIDSIVEEYSP